MKLKKVKKPLKKSNDVSGTQSEKVQKELQRSRTSSTTDEDNGDYGGLPAIDLKKNLGCG